MKKINFFLCLGSLIIFACSRKAEKPKITISDYTTQAITIKGMVDKIMHETDHKRMHEIALAVESSRAVSCVAVSDECNLLGKILNKIVSSTQSGLPAENDNIEIYKMFNQMDQELKIGHEKLASQWAEYLNAQAHDKK
ncbi:MAG: hypothetical protein WC635_06065 [Bacteriovorax sp.]|jgi:hypothetical protein